MAPDVSWHPQKACAALNILQGRYTGILWVWRHGKGLTKFNDCAVFVKLINQGEVQRDFSIDADSWTDTELIIKVNYYTRPDWDEVNAKVGWNLETGVLRVISSSKTGFRG